MEQFINLVTLIAKNILKKHAACDRLRLYRVFFTAIHNVVYRAVYSASLKRARFESIITQLHVTS